ncbi:MAG: hypothetical protein N4A47_07290 [Clostridia bacterium]|jgi:uncharacterized membrane protein|nr:hypothetical protein [Clostridia bacterium]
MNKTSIGIKENILVAACYFMIPLLPMLIFLFEKDNKKVKYHAMQAIVLLAAFVLLKFILIITLVGILLIPLSIIIYFVFCIYFIIVGLEGKDVRYTFFEKIIKKILD